VTDGVFKLSVVCTGNGSHKRFVLAQFVRHWTGAGHPLQMMQTAITAWPVTTAAGEELHVWVCTRCQPPRKTRRQERHIEAKLNDLATRPGTATWDVSTGPLESL
jgi:hypothetical protein